jgi:hypothetical protein
LPVACHNKLTYDSDVTIYNRSYYILGHILYLHINDTRTTLYVTYIINFVIANDCWKQICADEPFMQHRYVYICKSHRLTSHLLAWHALTPPGPWTFVPREERMLTATARRVLFAVGVPQALAPQALTFWGALPRPHRRWCDRIGRSKMLHRSLMSGRRSQARQALLGKAIGAVVGVADGAAPQALGVRAVGVADGAVPAAVMAGAATAAGALVGKVPRALRKTSSRRGKSHSPITPSHLWWSRWRQKSRSRSPSWLR